MPEQTEQVGQTEIQKPIVTLSLYELHEWIMDSTIVGEDDTVAESIDIEGGVPFADMVRLRTKANEAYRAVRELDRLYHEILECDGSSK